MGSSLRTTGESRIIQIASFADLDVSLVLKAPRTCDLFRGQIDLAVVGDYSGGLAFARLLNPSLPSTLGFLSPAVLAHIISQFSHKALDPRALLTLPEKDRCEAVDECCSLLYLGDLDPAYIQKFLFFVPSLGDDQEPKTEIVAMQYVTVAMYVATVTRARSVFFAGFDRYEGSFSESMIVRMTQLIRGLRTQLALPRLRVYFKYSVVSSARRIEDLTIKLNAFSAPLRTPARPAAALADSLAAAAA